MLCTCQLSAPEGPKDTTHDRELAQSLLDDERDILLRGGVSVHQRRDQRDHDCVDTGMMSLLAIQNAFEPSYNIIRQYTSTVQAGSRPCPNNSRAPTASSAHPEYRFAHRRQPATAAQ
jgi:hypothetical protein